MTTLQDQTIAHRELVLDSTERNVLGPDLVLDACHLLLKRPTFRNLTLRGLVLQTCSIETTAPLVDFTGWCACGISNCTFEGQFSGNSFGRWEDEVHVEGSLSACDFSGAELRGCQFIDVDLAGLRLPGWPFFTLRNPADRVDELAAFA